MSIYPEISENVQRGRYKTVRELVKKAISEGLPAAEILNEGLLSGMDAIGEKFKNNQVYLPEVLIAAKAMNEGIAVLKPLLAENGIRATGKVCIGTVKYALEKNPLNEICTKARYVDLSESPSFSELFIENIMFLN